MDSNILLESLPDLEVYILTIIGEARGEPVEGQIAVANVIKNRFNHGEYKGYKEVCLEPKQFSCWNQDDPNRALLLNLAQRFLNNEPIFDLNHVFKQCQWVAIGVFNNSLMDNTFGDKYYMTRTLFNGPNKPKWANNPDNLVVKGDQIFFNI